MQPCYRAFVNVTIKLDDTLCREARHRAVDANLSLSGWVAELIRERLGLAPGVRKRGASLLDLLGDERAGEMEIETVCFPETPRVAELDG